MRVAVPAGRDRPVAPDERERGDGPQRLALSAFFVSERIHSTQWAPGMGRSTEPTVTAAVRPSTRTTGTCFSPAASAVSGAGGLHLLAAAVAAHAGIVDVGDDVAAGSASVECHVDLLLRAERPLSSFISKVPGMGDARAFFADPVPGSCPVPDRWSHYSEKRRCMSIIIGPVRFGRVDAPFIIRRSFAALRSVV